MSDSSAGSENIPKRGALAPLRFGGVVRLPVFILKRMEA